MGMLFDKRRSFPRRQGPRCGSLMGPGLRRDKRGGHAVAAAFALLALSACASNPAQGAPRPAQSYGEIPAPTRDDVALTVTGADNGSAIEVKIGATIAVALIGVPTAGYVWSPVAAPPFLEADGEDGGPTSQAQLQPGFSGGRHWEVFFFRVNGEGDGVLRFEQRRIWEEETDPPSDVFEIAVAARAG